MIFMAAIVEFGADDLLGCTGGLLELLATPRLLVRWSLSIGLGKSFVALRFGGKEAEEGEDGLGSPVIEERISLI